MFQTKFLEKIEKYFVFHNLISNFVPFIGNVEKYSRAGQAADDNMAHAHCMLDN